MIGDLLRCAIVFAASLGLAWPFVARCPLSPPERLATCAALSLIGTFLLAWGIYCAGAKMSLLAFIPVLGGVSLALGRRSFATTLRDPEARALLSAQVILSTWAVGWLAFILNYSGGTWVGDWFGHWQRTLFFLERQPLDTLFNGFDPLSSRPPLANLLTAVFVTATERDFAHYQLGTTLLASLVFLPAALLARRWQPGQRIIFILAVLFMANPLFLQNATFAWTKLPSAMFVLLALYFFLRDAEAPPSRLVSLLWGLLLAAGILAHYSGGPYAVVLGIAALVRMSSRRHDRDAWIRLAATVAGGAALLLTWFGWAIAVYGVRGAFLANTTVTDAAPTFAAQLLTMAGNVLDTIVPHPLRGVGFELFAQRSGNGWWRDWFFQLYQVNLLFALGSLAWVVVLTRLWALRRTAVPGEKRWWGVFLCSTAVLGIVVHGGRDVWGLAHICLQPLVLLGLAFLASQWTSLGPGSRRWLVAAGAVDFCLGIVLQFASESFALDAWLRPGDRPVDIVFGHSQYAAMNLRAKLQGGWHFLGEAWVADRIWIAATLAFLLGLAVFRASRAEVDDRHRP